MNRKKQKLSLKKDEIQTQSQVEKMVVLRQKIMSMEAEMKLKNEEKDHLVKRVTSLEQELARKETLLKLKDEEQEYLVERVASLEQELAVKETQLKLKKEEQEHLEKRVTSLEKELKKKETQLQLIKEPFDALPNEVMLEIFKHLTQNELGKIARVCHRWNDLTQSSVLWQTVNVKFHRFRNSAFTSFINRLPCSLTSLTVHFPYITNWFQPLDFQELCVALQGKCDQLKQLVLGRSEFRTSLPSVVDLCTQFLPNLTSLALPFPQFLDSPTRVQHTDTSRIKILDVCGLFCIKQISFPNQIEVLHLGYTNITYRLFRAVKKHGQNLKELYMCMTRLHDDELSFDTPALPQLEIICLNNCRYVTHEGVVSLLRSCPSLQIIYVDKEVALSYARHSFVIANPCKLGIVKIINCREHIRKY